MAKLIIEDSEFDVKDGSGIIEECIKKDIPFGCQDGMCGTCVIDVLDGEDNLSEVSEQEKQLDMTKNKRLACQCKLKSGSVTIKSHY